MSIKKFNLVLMIFCMFFLFNQIRGILDNSLNNFVWISIAVKVDEIKEGNSVSNIIIFKMFKFLPFVKIAKVTYSQ